MRILVIGAGVLGCNIAANLFRAGKDVTLLARGAWGKTIRERGLRIKSRFRPGVRTYHIPVIGALRPDDIYDAIIVSLRFTQLPTLYDVLNANGSRTIICNGNNTRPEETARRLPGKDVLFSFTLSAGHREPDRVCSIDLKKVTIGSCKGGPDSRALAEEVFGGAGYRVVCQPNMGDYLLSHAAVVVPVAFACYHSDGDLRKLRGDRAYLEKVVRANQEANAALEAAGHAILPESNRAFRTEKWFKAVVRVYRLLCATSLGRLLASDHAMSAVDEMQALAEDIGEVIAASGLPSPAFDELRGDIAKYL